MPALGLGTMGFGGYFQEDKSDFSRHVELIEVAHSLGIRVLDTAEVYGNGAAEKIIGKVSANIKNSMFIMSKFSPHRTTPSSIQSALEHTLRRIGRDYIDVYQPHWPNPDIDINEIFDCLDKLRDEGKLRYIGVSNFNAAQLTGHASEISPKFLQCEFNPVNQQQGIELLEHSKKSNGIVVCYSPFQEGKLFSSVHVSKLAGIAEDLRCTQAQLYLAWIMSHGRTLPIPKTSNLTRLEENIGSLAVNISQEIKALISKNFELKVNLIKPNIIRPFDKSSTDNTGRPLLRTLEEAIANTINLSPSPSQIADEINANNGHLNKPIKIRSTKDGNFVLVEGRLRYWGWIISYGWNKPIPSIILTDNES